MPVVKTKMTFFSGKPFKQVYCVDAKTGVFYMKLPPLMVTAMNIPDRIKSDKLDQLNLQWDKLKAKYESMQTTTRKVIIYRYKTTARIYERPTEDPRGR